jgi:aconitate hydratase
MGVLPLQFQEGDSAASLGLTGRETFDVRGLSGGISPRQEVAVHVTREDGSRTEFTALARIDGPAEVDSYLAGGILQMVLRQMLADPAGH